MLLPTRDVAIADIKPHPYNPRHHEQEQTAELTASLDEDGWLSNVILSVDGYCLHGHGIIGAAKSRGDTHVPVVDYPHPHDDPRSLKVLVKMNTLGMPRKGDPRTPQDDDEVLSGLLRTIQESDAGLKGTGHDDETLAALLEEVAAQRPPTGFVPEEDPGPGEPPVDPVTRLGDVWVMGEHRLVCGDCTEQTVVDAALRGTLADLVFTDPPYGIDYVAQSLVAGQYESISADDAKDIGFRYAEWGRMWFASTTKEATCYAFNSPSKPATRTGLEGSGWEIKDTIVWVKPTFAPGRNDYQNRWESLLYARKGVGHYWCGRRDLSNVWEFGRDLGVEHPTNKPVELVAHGIANSSKRGGVVLDSFLGSGTTLIACEQLGRRCVGIELAEKYVDVAVARWCKLTGHDAILESTGETFDALSSRPRRGG